MADIVWDTRSLYVYAQTPKDRYDIIEKRYQSFLAAMKDKQTDPVTVFYPLSEKQLNELTLIREVSQVLQAKKDEDIRKSKAAAEDAEKEKAAKKAEQDAEVEEEKEETVAEEKTEA